MSLLESRDIDYFVLVIGRHIEPVGGASDDLSVHIPTLLRKQTEQGDYVNADLSTDKAFIFTICIEKINKM